MKQYIFLFFLFVVISSCSKSELEPTKSNAKSILAFSFNNPQVNASIDSVQRIITVLLPIGTDATKLSPNIIISSRATVSPASGVVQDFTKPVIYTITAENGSSQTYTVQTTIAKSAEKEIKKFSFENLSPIINATIDSSKKNISAILPSTVDVTKLIPTITVSNRATISPASGVAQDFTKPVTYTVTAENGSIQIYTVTILSGITITISIREGLAGGTTYLLSNGKSTIHFDVNVYDKNKNVLPKDGLKFYADDTEIPNLSFSTKNEGFYNIYAKGYNTTSNIVKAIARRDEVFEVVRIPLIFHLMYKNDTWTKANLNQMIDYVNKVYAGSLHDDNSPKRDPNTVNTYIQFYLADTDPNGKKLEILGLNKVSEDPKLYGTGSDPEVIKNATAASWDPTKYMNIFLYKSQYPNAANGVFPKLPSNKPLNGVSSATSNGSKTSYGVYWPGDFKIDTDFYFSAFAHELGHCLALGHVFQESNCSQDFDYCLDTPVFLSGELTKGNVRTACSQVRFLGTNVMDYSVQSLGCFTYDQRIRMRHIIDWAYELPTKINKNR